MIRDDIGRMLDLKTPVRRIVSLAPVATENLFAIGAGRLIVADTTVCDYPDAAKRLPKVGNFYVPLYEKIRALRPDVVIIDSGTITPQVADVVQSRCKLPVYVQKSVTFDDVVRHIEQLGMLTGTLPQARRVADEMRRKSESAARFVRGKAAVTVFVEVSRTPLYAAGVGSFVDDLVHRCGGVNVIKTDNPYPLLPKEDLLALNPQRYIVTYSGNPARTKAEPFPAPLDKLAAVRNGGLRYIPSDLLFRSTPRLADGLLLLARLLHD